MNAPARIVCGQDDWEGKAEKEPASQEAFEIPEQQFEQWVFGGAPGGQGSKRLETQLTLQVESIDRVCRLSDAQKQKLLLAGRGDTRKFFESMEEGRKKFQANRRNQDFNRVWQDVQPLQMKFQTGLFGEGSLFGKVLHKTLDPEQSARYEQQEAERRRFRYEATIGLVVTMLESSVPLRDEQRQKLIEVLLKETRPPSKSGQYDYYVVLCQAAKLGEDKLKPIFDAAQWQALRRSFNQVQGMEVFLKQNGVLP